MGRALVILTLLVAVPSIAHAGASMTLPVSRANVVLPAGWEVTGVGDGGFGDLVTGPSGVVLVFRHPSCDQAWSSLDRFEGSEGKPDLADLPSGWSGRVWPTVESFCHQAGDIVLVVRSEHGRDGLDPLLEALATAWFSSSLGQVHNVIVLPGTGLLVQLDNYLTVVESDRATQRDVLEVGPHPTFDPDGIGSERVTIMRSADRCADLMSIARADGAAFDWSEYTLDDGRRYFCQELAGWSIVVDVPDAVTLGAAFPGKSAGVIGFTGLLNSLQDELVVPPPGEVVVLPTTGYRVALLDGWRLGTEDNGADKLIGPPVYEMEKGIVVELSSSTCAESLAFQEERGTNVNDAGWLPKGSFGLFGGSYCVEIEGANLAVTTDAISAVTRAELAAFIASLVRENSTEVVDTGGGETPFDGGGQVIPPERRSRSGGGFSLGAFLPRSILGAVVRRADDAGRSFGFGLSLSRLTWRQHKRRAIGYDITVGAAEQWWTVSAQLRPGVSAMIEDLGADAYLALGVDGTGGDNGPEVPFAPVVGVGADIIAPLPLPFALDLAGQILFDPTGLHSHTLHAGVVLGSDGPTRPRIGVSYIDHYDAGSVWLMTLGVIFLGAER